MRDALSVFGNPSSIHKEGLLAKKALEEARREISILLGVKRTEIIFTGGATEANNMVILGASKNHKDGHIITSLSEHPSVLGPCRELEKGGCKVTYLEPDKRGVISEEKVLCAIVANTFLVSLSLVNGETGTIEPLRKIINSVKKKRDRILFHSDVSQCAGLLDLSPDNLGLDFMTISVGKISGPKKFAFLFKKEGRKLEAIFFGGGQEQGISPGTENIPLIMGGAKALIEADKNRKKEYVKMLNLQKHFVAYLKKKMPDIPVLGEGSNVLPSVVIVGTGNLSAEALVLALDDAGLSVSSGSACVANSKYSRKTETIRFSFGRETTKNQIEKAIDIFHLTFIRFKKIYNNN